MLEKDYYENPFLWDTTRYLENQAELERFNRIISIIPEDVSSLVDIGCGNGAFLYLLRNQKKIYSIGLERSKTAIDVARKNFNIEVIEGEASSLPFTDDSFDAVTALEVIEHLPYGIYEKALGELERVAKKYIIISVPYKEREVLTQCPYCGCRFNPNFHLRRFDNYIINNLFNRFKLITLELIVPYYEIYLYETLSSLYKLIFKPQFPQYAVCPACGYKRINDSDQESGNSENIVNNKIRNIINSNFIPKKKKFRWAIAVYEKEDKS